MAFNFENLDQITREYMLREIDFDIASSNLYTSKRFSDTGASKYPMLLKLAVQNGSEVTLSSSLKDENCFQESETRLVKGKTITAKVPANAADLFAEGEFNRYYLRAICLRALEGSNTIQIYRARESSSPRQESLALIGTEVDPQKLLNDLRNSIGVDTVLGLPPGPNSGLSGRIV